MRFESFLGWLVGVGLLAQPAARSQPVSAPGAWKVLELDGANSFVELPAGAFTNLDEVTVEGWVKWERFGSSSRFFDFTLAGCSLNLQNRFPTPTLHAELFRRDEGQMAQVSDFLSLDRWTHVAVAAGAQGLSLFVNGMPLATSSGRGQFVTAGVEKRNYLGRSNWKVVYTHDADFCGQMAEVRVWKGVRSGAQIRGNVFKRLTGQEEGLAGLWNFADGTAADASPAGHHGRLFGQARVRTHLELMHSRDVIVRYSQALRALNDEKNEFMGIVAHDLRNPLSVVQGYAEMVIEDAQALPHGELEANGRRIRETAERMAEMVQNLLDANRIERGEMRFNPVPTELTGLLAAVVEAQRPRATAKQQALHFESDPTPVVAVVDPSVTAQVLENLVSNAVKYSPPGKNIFVQLRRHEGGVRCQVRDEGPGLSAEDRQRLFGKFARLSAKPTGGEHSTGLGLSIVKKMVETMKGKVWCESEPGKGATFIVALPLEASQAQNPPRH